MTPRLVLATRNDGKLTELREILAGVLAPEEIVSAQHLDLPEVKETGLTFAQNAALKARAVAEQTGLIALADDSGLSVDVLGGAPGIFSARWAGRQAPGLLLAGAVALIGLGMWTHGFASTLGGYALGVAIWTIGEIAFLPVMPAYVAQMAPDNARGTYQGVYGAGWGLAHSTGPIAGGFVLGSFGPQALWSACLVVSLMASFTILVMRPALRRRIMPGA